MFAIFGIMTAATMLHLIPPPDPSPTSPTTATQPPSQQFDPPPPPPPPGEHPQKDWDQPQPPNEKPAARRSPGPRHRQTPPRGPIPPGPRVGQRPGAPHPGPGREPGLAPFLRMVQQRRPDLARRLQELRRDDPQRFRQVIEEALMLRLEAVLDEFAQPNRGRPHDQLERRRHHEGNQRHQERQRREREEHMRRQIEELERRHDELDRRSHELAHRIREMRNEEAHDADRDRLHHELHEVVNQQFDVRGRLRRHNLEQLECEHEHIQRMLDEQREALERRDAERDLIIEQRVRRLLGDDISGW